MKSAPILIAAGGILVAAGGLAPEAIDLAWRVLHPGAPKALIDRSHWIVFRESLDMLIHPVPSLPFMFNIFYAAEVIGLTYPVVAGILIAGGAFFPGSRAAAAAGLLLHATCFWILSVAALALAASGAAEEAAADPKTSLRYVAVAAILSAFLLIEIAAAFRAVRSRRRARMPLVDAVNLTPAAFLILLNAILFILLCRHPNWPASGYAASGLGALLAASGMILRGRASLSL